MTQKMSSRVKLGVLALTGAAMLLPMATPAQASKRGKQYKTGAIALGALGVYFAVKKKPLGAVAAGAGAYYLYKKGRKEDRRDNRRNANTYPDDRYYGYNPQDNGNAYPSDNGYPSDNSYPDDSGSYALR